MSEIEQIAHTVLTLALPGMKPKDLLGAVRKQHPAASKKDLSRAAFLAAILTSQSDPEKALQVHDLALASRTPDSTVTDVVGDDPPPPVQKRKRQPSASANGR